MNIRMALYALTLCGFFHMSATQSDEKLSLKATRISPEPWLGVVKIQDVSADILSLLASMDRPVISRTTTIIEQIQTLYGIEENAYTPLAYLIQLLRLNENRGHLENFLRLYGPFFAGTWPTIQQALTYNAEINNPRLVIKPALREQIRQFNALFITYLYQHPYAYSQNGDPIQTIPDTTTKQSSMLGMYWGIAGGTTVLLTGIAATAYIYMMNPEAFRTH